MDRENRNRVSERNSVSSQRILIIGYGNPIRGDDALGWVVAERLARSYEADSRVEILSVQQLTYDIAEKLAESNLVILIDAMDASPVGELYTRKIHSSQDLPQPFSHYLTPEDLLSVCRNLYHTTPETILTGIKSTYFEAGESISTPVLERIPLLIDKVEEIIAGG